MHFLVLVDGENNRKLLETVDVKRWPDKPNVLLFLRSENKQIKSAKLVLKAT